MFKYLDNNFLHLILLLFMRYEVLTASGTLKNEAASPYETLVPINHTTKNEIPESTNTYVMK
jgi:hypothetical protein